MATQVTIRFGASDPTTVNVQESVSDVTDAVNAALSNDLKFIALTGDDGKEFSVVATHVKDVREV
jgi:hypothetical protein